jgi:FAD dependent monooxygenase
MNSVKVRCADGTEFVGDIVVGADGIHSRVRQEMQRLLEENNPGSTARDQECITAEYNCMFGVSEPTSTLPPGHVHISQDIDHSALLFVGKSSVPQWFFISKMDQKYHGRSIPRFTKPQMEEQVTQYADFQFTKGLSFKDLLKTTTTMNYLALEEARHEFWTHGRIVCAGDSIHKMTPNVRLTNHILRCRITESSSS